MIDTPLDVFLDNRFTNFYRAKVVDNKDPEKLGRVKIDHPVYENVPVDKRPWVLRVLPSYPDSQGQFAVPNVGDEVLVAFLDGSPYTPVYLGYMTVTSFGHDGGEYPDDYGWMDSYGNKWHVKPKVAEEAIFTHQSGSQLIFRKNGDIELIPKTGQKVKVTGALHVTEDISVDGSVSVTGSMTATACCCSGKVPALTTTNC